MCISDVNKLWHINWSRRQSILLANIRWS